LTLLSGEATRTPGVSLSPVLLNQTEEEHKWIRADSTGTSIEIANALKITRDDVKEYFTDGRRVSFLIEHRLAHEVFGGSLARSQGAGYDLEDTKRGKWEVRSISRGGIYFCPSYMVGSGRSFNVEGFLEKLSEIDGYVLADIESFPRVPFWILPVFQVRYW